MTNKLRSIFALIIGLSVVFLSLNLLPESGFSPNSDEGYYYFYAKTVHQGGLETLKDLVEWYYSDQQARLHPPPSRVGFIVIISMLFDLFGQVSFVIIGLISFIAWLCFILLFFNFIKKYFSIDLALISTSILSCSPLLMAMARRALTDSLSNLFFLIILILLFEFLSFRKLKYLVFMSFVCIGALLVKESSVLLLLSIIFLMYFAPIISFKRVKLLHYTGFVVLTLGGYLIVMYLIFGFQHLSLILRSLLDIQLNIKSFNPYVVKYCLGGWDKYLIDWFLLIPVTLLLFFYYCLRFKDNLINHGLTKFFLFYFIIMYGFYSFLQNNKVIRYAMNLEMVIVLFATLALIDIISKSCKNRVWESILAVVILIFYMNITTFYQIFVLHGVLDPVTHHLLVGKQLIPY